jgi:hypothetical protein
MITVSQLKMEFESSEAIKEKKSRRIAFFSTIGFYAILLIILVFIKFTPPNPPWTEPGGGAEITLGEDLIGMNNTFESVASSDQPQQQQVISTQPEETIETLQDENDPESAPIEEKKQIEKKQEIPKQHTVVTQQVQQEKQPTVNQDALFTKKSGTGNDPNGTATNKGTGYTPGNQGDPNGNPNSHSWEKYGDGTDGKGIGIQGDLRGRGIISLPAPEKNYVEGKVVVEVCIDQEGNVISARGGGKGSTITNPSTVEEAEKKARQSKFKPDPNAPSMQCGQIIYNFRPQ